MRILGPVFFFFNHKISKLNVEATVDLKQTKRKILNWRLTCSMQSDSAAWLAEKICLPEQIYRGGKGRKRWTGRLLAETKVMSLGIIFFNGESG